MTDEVRQAIERLRRWSKIFFPFQEQLQRDAVAVCDELEQAEQEAKRWRDIAGKDCGDKLVLQVENNKLRARLDKAEEACEAQREQIRAMSELIKEVMENHRDKASSDYNACEVDFCRWCENAIAAIGKEI